MINLREIYGNKKKILLIGSYPPPLGGISVFIYRLNKILKKDGYHVHIFNTAKNYRIFGLKFFRFIIKILSFNYEIIHVQDLEIKKFLALLIFRPIKKYEIYFTNHNPFLFETDNKLMIKFRKFFISKVDKLIVVNDHILINFKTRNISLPSDVIVNNAFIPPPLEEKNKILLSYPESLFLFLNDHQPLIIANAFQLKLYEGNDLYGLDMCITLTKRLKPVFPKIGFIFCLANEKTNNHLYLSALSDLKQCGLYSDFYFLTGQKELWPLFEKVDLFVRPTYKDGYGISIDESLYFGCPAVASDACVRHQETIIFKNRDDDDFFVKCMGVLNNIK